MRTILSILVAATAICAWVRPADAANISPSLAMTAPTASGLNGYVYHTGTNSGTFTKSVAGALSYVTSNGPNTTYLGPSAPFNYDGNDGTPTNTFIGTGSDTALIAESIIDVKGLIQISSTGTYNFGLNNDDGGAIWIGGNGTSGSGTEVVNDDGSHGQDNQTGSGTFTATGLYEFEAIYYDHNPSGTGGTGSLSGAHFDLSGTDPSSSPVVFLHAVPEPSSIVALVGVCGMGLIGLVLRRRRTS